MVIKELLLIKFFNFGFREIKLAEGHVPTGLVNIIKQLSGLVYHTTITFKAIKILFTIKRNLSY